MRIKDLNGKTFIVVDVSPWRILLEEFDAQMDTNKFILIQPRNLEGSIDGHGDFKISELPVKEMIR